ncbi:MAG: hypothetical protein JWM69_1214, partial [Candidatus Binatus sp.]|nr:hypothetical protein [Candidatus Binatus sp.]
DDYFGLSGTGGEMWRQLAEHGSVEQAVDALAGQFEAEAETIRADILALVEELESRSLVTVERDPGEKVSGRQSSIKRKQVERPATAKSRGVKANARAKK